MKTYIEIRVQILFRKHVPLVSLPRLRGLHFRRIQWRVLWLLVNVNGCHWWRHRVLQGGQINRLYSIGHYFCDLFTGSDGRR